MQRNNQGLSTTKDHHVSIFFSYFFHTFPLGPLGNRLRCGAELPLVQLQVPRWQVLVVPHDAMGLACESCQGDMVRKVPSDMALFCSACSMVADIPISMVDDNDASTSHVLRNFCASIGHEGINDAQLVLLTILFNDANICQWFSSMRYLHFSLLQVCIRHDNLNLQNLPAFAQIPVTSFEMPCLGTFGALLATLGAFKLFLRANSMRCTLRIRRGHVSTNHMGPAGNFSFHLL